MTEVVHKWMVRTTLGEQVVLAIVEHIQENGLKPGDMLPSELAMAQQIGVSRPLVREAIRSLAALGVLATANGKGTTICSVSSRGMTTLLEWAVTIQGVSPVGVLELREGLEVEAARLAAENRTDDEAAGLIEMVGEMREALDDEEYARFDFEFHVAITQSAHNVLLLAFVNALRHVAVGAISAGRGIATPEELIQTQASHEKLAAAIAAKDGTMALDTMLEHFGSSIQRFQRAYSVDGQFEYLGGVS